MEFDSRLSGFWKGRDVEWCADQKIAGGLHWRAVVAVWPAVEEERTFFTTAEALDGAFLWSQVASVVEQVIECAHLLRLN